MKKQHIDIEYEKGNRRGACVKWGKHAESGELSKRFKHYHQINFEMDKSVHQLFSSDLNPDELCKNHSA